MKEEPRPGVVRWLLGMSVGRLSLLLVALTFVLYGQTLNHGYNMDDELVTRNHRLTSKGLQAIPEIFTSPYYEDDMGYSYGYRPVALTTFAIEHTLFGERPLAGHLINLLLFALTGVLVFRIVLELNAGPTVMFPLLTALLFIAHPLHTEVVCSIKNREELLALLGGLLALWFLLRHLATGRAVFLLLMTLSLIAGLLSKLSVMSFVVMLPVVAMMRSRAWGPQVTVLLICAVILGATSILRSVELWSRAVWLPVLLVGGVGVLRVVYYDMDVLHKLAGRVKSFFRLRYRLLTGLDAPDTRTPLGLGRLLMVLVPSAASIGLGFHYEMDWLIFAGCGWLAVHPLVAGRFSIPLAHAAMAVVPLALITLHCRPILLVFLLQTLQSLALLRLGAIPMRGLLTLSLTLMGVLFASIALTTQEFTSGISSLIPFFAMHIPVFVSNGKKRQWALRGVYLFLTVAVIVEFMFPNPYNILPPALIYALVMGGRLSVRWQRALFMLLLVLPTVSVILMSTFSKQPVHIPTEQQVGVAVSPMAPDSVPVARNLRPPLGTTLLGIGDDRPLTMTEFPLGFDATAEQRIATASVILGHYVRQLVVGGPQAFYYGFQHFERTDLRDPVALVCLSLLTVLLMVALVLLYLRSVAGFGLLLMLSSLAVVSNLFEPVAGMAGDRLTYVASFGFCMALAYGLTMLYQRLTAPVPVKVFALAVGVLLVVWSGMTMARAAKWKDALTLMRHDIRTVPTSAQAHNLLASHLMKNSFEPEYVREANAMRMEAIGHFKQAARIWPEFFNVWYDLGRSYMTVNQPDNALPAYKEAHRLDSTFYDATINVAVVSEQRGNLTQAVEYYERCIRFNPEMLEPYGNLSYLHFREGRYEESIAVNERAIVQNPNWPDPYLNIARTYDIMGKPDKAAEYRSRANLQK